MFFIPLKVIAGYRLSLLYGDTYHIIKTDIEPIIGDIKGVEVLVFKHPVNKVKDYSGFRYVGIIENMYSINPDLRILYHNKFYYFHNFHLSQTIDPWLAIGIGHIQHMNESILGRMLLSYSVCADFGLNYKFLKRYFIGVDAQWYLVFNSEYNWDLVLKLGTEL